MKEVLLHKDLSKIKNLTGVKCGMLTPVELDGWYEFTSDNGKKYRDSKWLCECECGNNKVVTGRYLRETRRPRGCGCVKNLVEGEASFNHLIRQYRYRAKTKNRIFELSIDEFQKMIFGNCHYCNRKPHKTHQQKGKNKFKGAVTFNGIDRVDSNSGYQLNNCVSCCEICNKAKRDMPYWQFIEWLNDIATYRGEHVKN